MEQANLEPQIQNPDFSFDIANWEKRMNVVHTGVTLLCVRNTQWHQGHKLYSSSSGFQSSNNSSESHKLNDHSKVRNFDKLLRAHIQDQFTSCKKCGSAHLFRKTWIWLPELLLYFLYDTRSLLEDTPVFNHPIVKAGSRSTGHTVCKEYCSHRRNRIWHNYA